MKTTDPIKNNEKIIAIAKTGEKLEYRFGQLKEDFQSKKLKFEIAKVYVPRTKQNYFIVLRPTQGCVFKKINA